MKYLLLLMLLLPAFVFSQANHYDTLFQKGLISREDYLLLNKQPKPSSDSPHYQETSRSQTPTDPRFYQELKKWQKLLNKGLITKQEFEEQKRKILGE